MKAIREKFKKKENGFTLAELLIVVAIIAILVAISIPIFTSQLNKSKEQTDRANERAAKSAAISAFLIEDDTSSSITYFFDAENGVVTKTNSGIKGYGKTRDHLNKIVQVVVTPSDSSGTTTADSVSISWTGASGQ